MSSSRGAVGAHIPRMSALLPVFRGEVSRAPWRAEVVAPRAVRLSVTDRCDMACVYCRPAGSETWVSPRDRLDVDAWTSLVAALTAGGIRRVRITGGEPLLYRDLVHLVERLATLGLDDLALTTNGARLGSMARSLRAAGLRRVNVSLDSLDAPTFARMTRGGDLTRVRRGLDAACAAGFDEVKTNTVVLRGENDGELDAITQHVWSRGATPRFLELMGVGEGRVLGEGARVSSAAQRAALAHLLDDGDGAREAERGPAVYLRARDGSGRRVGFIAGATETFCEGCDRLRVTSDGVLRSCLARTSGVAVGAVLREGAEGDALRAAMRVAWSDKPDGAWRGCTEESAASVSMRATGG